MKFIKDEEIKNLNSNDDLLETKKYANTLKEMSLNAKTPFTIGLFGEWGSGKSSIVNTAQHELEKEDTEKIVFIEYDAWKYENDSFRRMFLKTIQEGLKFDRSEEFESFYINKNTTTKIDKKINKPFIFISLIIIVLGLLSIFFLPKDLAVEWKITIPLFISIFGLSISIARNFFDSYNVAVQNPALFAPEQFEEIFDDMMKKSLKKYSMTERLTKWVQGENYIKDIDKLVIVVDNIDRCDKETAYELLIGIKNFLEKDGIIFIVPIDDDALRRHLKEKNNEDNQEADEFLRKIFNVTLKIKHFQSRDLFIFTDSLNNKYELGLQADTIDIIAKEYATNPRRIIQLLNNLTSELNVIEQKNNRQFVEKYESLICKLLIIREEWGDIYKEISTRPHLLNKGKDLLFSEKDDISNFLHRTRAVSEYVDDKVIENLLSNMNNDLKVPNEVLESIKNKNYGEINHFIENRTNYIELLRFLIEDLRKEVERRTFRSGVLNRYIDIISLNELKEIPYNINKKLYHEIDEENIKIILNSLSSDDFEKFYKFVESNQKMRLDYLERIALKKHQDTWSDYQATRNSSNHSRPQMSNVNRVWLLGIKEYINNSTNIDEIRKLNFANYYHLFFNVSMFKNKWINEDKLEYCITSSLIESIARGMDNTFDDDSYQEIIYFSKLISINISQIQPIFNNLVDKNTQVIAQNPVKYKAITSLKDIFSLTERINKLMINIHFSEIQTGKVRNIINFFNLDDFIKNISEKKVYQIELIKFYLEIYIRTNDSHLLLEIIELVKKYSHLEEKVFEYLVNIKETLAFELNDDYNKSILNLSNILDSKEINDFPEFIQALRQKS